MCYFEIKAKRTLSDTSFSNAQNGTYLFFQTGNEKWKNESRVKNKNQIFKHSIILCEYSRLSSCNMLFMLQWVNANILDFVRASYVRNIYSLDEEKVFQ